MLEIIPTPEQESVPIPTSPETTEFLDHAQKEGEDRGRRNDPSASPLSESGSMVDRQDLERAQKAALLDVESGGRELPEKLKKPVMNDLIKDTKEVDIEIHDGTDDPYGAINQLAQRIRGD